MKTRGNDARIIAREIISYLRSKDKLNLISEITDILLKETDSKLVSVYCANALSDSQKKKVISKFSKHTGSDDFKFILDESLIGGMIVKYKDKTWDLSLKNSLEKLQQ